ncbi:MAG: CPBP family intramembrane metalloprotease [Nitrospirae bacterium]|nr:CPBP family intramembrane metalloprotease [Nitrospirota bacterium]
MVTVYHAFSFGMFKYLIPFFLVVTPILLAGGIKMQFNLRDSILGVITSAIILVPFWLVMIMINNRPQPPTLQVLMFQLLGVSLSEEVYFRGYLQESLGNTMRGVFLTSGLFAVMHLPQLVFYGDWYSLMTFFPSLVMGFLYLQTSNVLPSVIFHFAANILFLGFFAYRP